jgi:hypothetical protein
VKKAVTKKQRPPAPIVFPEELQQEPYILHCGECHPLDSPEAEVLLEVRKDRPYFPTVLNLLRDELGWSTVWCREVSQDKSLHLPVWAMEKHGQQQLFNKNYWKSVTALVSNVDYFVDDDAGKAELLSYLRCRGFQRSECDRLCASLTAEACSLMEMLDADLAAKRAALVAQVTRERESAQQQAMRARQAQVAAAAEKKQKPAVDRTGSVMHVAQTAVEHVAATRMEGGVEPLAVKARRTVVASSEAADSDSSDDESSGPVVILGVEYPAGGTQAYVYEKVCEPQPWYGGVIGVLRQHLGWFSTWSAGWPNTKVFAPWARERAPTAFDVPVLSNGRPGKIKCTSVKALTENIDYFEGTSAVCVGLVGC